MEGGGIAPLIRNHLFVTCAINGEDKWLDSRTGVRFTTGNPPPPFPWNSKLGGFRKVLMFLRRNNQLPPLEFQPWISSA
jgi:hypothetical protein